MIDSIIYELANVGLTLLCFGVLAVVTIWLGNKI